MNAIVMTVETRYRLWICTYGRYRPRTWDQVLPRVRAVQPAVDGSFNAAQARAFLEGFNSAMLERPDGRWAVAVPVTVSYENDLLVGQFLEPTLPPGPCGTAA